MLVTHQSTCPQSCIRRIGGGRSYLVEGITLGQEDGRTVGSAVGLPIEAMQQKGKIAWLRQVDEPALVEEEEDPH